MNSLLPPSEVKDMCGAKGIFGVGPCTVEEGPFHAANGGTKWRLTDCALFSFSGCEWNGTLVGDGGVAKT